MGSLSLARFLILLEVTHLRKLYREYSHKTVRHNNNDDNGNNSFLVPNLRHQTNPFSIWSAKVCDVFRDERDNERR